MKIQVYDGTGVNEEDQARLLEEQMDHIVRIIPDFQKHLVTPDRDLLQGRSIFGSRFGSNINLWCPIALSIEEMTEAGVIFCQKDIFVMPNMLNGNNNTEGGDVIWANYRYFIKQWDHERIFKLRGDHAAYGVVIPLDLVDGDMREALLGLEDYPVLCDETASEVASELQDLEWINTYREDFVETLRKSDTLRSSKALDEFDFDNESLISALRALLEDGTEVWTPTSGAMGFSILSMADLVRRVTPEMIEEARKFWS